MEPGCSRLSRFSTSGRKAKRGFEHFMVSSYKETEKSIAQASRPVRRLMHYIRFDPICEQSCRRWSFAIPQKERVSQSSDRNSRERPFSYRIDSQHSLPGHRCVPVGTQPNNRGYEPLLGDAGLTDKTGSAATGITRLH